MYSWLFYCLLALDGTLGILLIIGGATFGNGCDPDLSSRCGLRIIYHMNGTYLVNNHTCTICTNQKFDCSDGYWFRKIWYPKCRPYCANTTQYDCFDVDLVYEYSPGNKCSFRKESGVNVSSRNASDYENKTVVGGISVEKITGVCFEELNDGLTAEKINVAKTGFAVMLGATCGIIVTTTILIVGRVCYTGQCTRRRRVCTCCDRRTSEPQPQESGFVGNQVPGMIVINIAPKKSTRDNEQCPICLENIRGECATFKCMHLSHKECFDKWMLEKHTCPVCRREA